MKYQNATERFQTLLSMALQLREAANAFSLMLLAEGPFDWERLKKQVGETRTLLAVENNEHLTAAQEVGFPTVMLPRAELAVHEGLSQALLQGVAAEKLPPNARVVALYSGFEAETIDSVSVISLGEHLDRLKPRDLRDLNVRVPLDTLKLVVDVAVEIGREGREGKPVGTLFVVGDHRKTLEHSRPAGFDPVKGYTRKERDLHDRRVREGIKEIAQLDGAFIVEAKGVVAAACRILDVRGHGLTLSKGLGARHWAAADITKTTKAVSVVVSESSGTVRIFQNGELILRIEPFKYPVIWRDFDYEPPLASSE